MGSLSSMNIFLRQEIDRMQKVITVVRSTLQDLQLAIEGTIIMSEVGGLGIHNYGCFNPLMLFPHLNPSHSALILELA